MNSESSIKNGYTFQVRCASAEQVKLVIARRRGESQVLPLRPRGGGVWQTVLDLDPGEYRYCYHAYDGLSLSYMVPTDAPLDGVKAVLRVGEVSQLETRS